MSVLLVHPPRQNAPGGVAAGLGLRGSGDLPAFGDSNLELRRTPEHLVLSSEHRAAPASAPLDLEWVATPAATTHLAVVAELAEGKPRGLEERVLDYLSSGAVRTRTQLREVLAVPNERLGLALGSLERAGRLRHTPAGWQRVP